MIDEIIIKPYPGESEETFIKRKSYFNRLLRVRFESSNDQLRNLEKYAVPLTAQEQQHIDELWAQYLPDGLRRIIIQDKYYEFYKAIKPADVDLYKYMPDAFLKTFIDDYFTNPQHSYPCDDKNLYDLYFHDVKRPVMLFRKVKGVYMDADYNIISQGTALAMAREQGEVICKVAKFSGGGSGIMIWNSATDDKSKLLDYLNMAEYIVCQQMLKQHPVMSSLNATSLNTMRIMTLMFNNKANVIASMMRMGPKGSRVDNASKGGAVVGILPTGQLKNVGWDGTGERYDIHPQGHLRFESVTIPNYQACVDLVTSLAPRMGTISRMISWDVALDEKGEPVLMEFNVTFSGTASVQMTNGPLFGDLTEDVLKEVFANSYTLKSIIKSFNNGD